MTRESVSRIIMAAAAAAMMIVTCASCDTIYDDLDPCRQGVSLRFVYDYNMEYANAFPSKVDCLTLYVYDGDGHFVASRTETTAVLADEAYRMQLDLAEGDYHFVAYGGMACDKSSFAPVSEPHEGSTLSELQTAMNRSGDTSDSELHGFYFGETDMHVSAGTTTYDEGTVEMMKDTNNLRIMLQQLSGEPVSSGDFTFAVTDDNTLFSNDNTLIPNGMITYLPWTRGEVSTGTRADGGDADEEVVVAYAELSLSRLATTSSPRLVVSRSEDGEEVINIPLINYLLLIKSDHYGAMGSQEFLDRQSEWSMIFFLDEDNRWVNTYIVVNDWVVRINDASI